MKKASASEQPAQRFVGLDTGVGGFLDGGLVGVGDAFFVAAKTLDVRGELGPFGAFQGEKKFIDIAETVFAAGQSGFDFLGDRQGAKHLVDGLVQKGVGDGEQAHEKQTGLFFAQADGMREFLAKIGASEGGADEFGRLAAAHRHDREDGDPAAKLLFAQQGKGLADTVHFSA